MRVTGARLCLLSLTPLLAWIFLIAAQILLRVAVPECHVLKRHPLDCGWASTVAVFLDFLVFFGGIVAFLAAPGFVVGGLLWLLGLWWERGTERTHRAGS